MSARSWISQQAATDEALAAELEAVLGGLQSHIKRSAGYKRHITAEAADASFVHDLGSDFGRVKGSSTPLLFLSV